MFYNKNEIARIVNLFHSIGYGCLLLSPGITMLFPKSYTSLTILQFGTLLSYFVNSTKNTSRKINRFYYYCGVLTSYLIYDIIKSHK
jgi:hypothetical protein